MLTENVTVILLLLLLLLLLLTLLVCLQLHVLTPISPSKATTTNVFIDSRPMTSYWMLQQLASEKWRSVHVLDNWSRISNVRFLRHALSFASLTCVGCVYKICCCFGDFCRCSGGFSSL